jgi:hypothetical protein
MIYFTRYDCKLSNRKSSLSTIDCCVTSSGFTSLDYQAPTTASDVSNFEHRGEGLDDDG